MTDFANHPHCLVLTVDNCFKMCQQMCFFDNGVSDHSTFPKLVNTEYVVLIISF